MPRVNILVGPEYIADLKRRMEKLEVKPVELAREIGKTKQEISRWLNSEERFGKPMIPSMSNVAKIEQALIDLTRRKSRRVAHRKNASAK